MRLIHIFILAVIQGLAELLPVSSSAHVITAAKFLKIDPASPQFGLLLVMLHTGTMFAVIVYFWRAWLKTFFPSEDQFIRFATKIVIATGITGGLGFGLIKGIERILDPGYTQFISWSISNARDPHHAPKELTLLADLVATDTPDTKLFHVGETFTVNVKKDGEPLPYEQITVKPKSTLKDLEVTFTRGFGINTNAKPLPNGDKPGVELVADPDLKHPNAVRIRVTGNLGRANHLKLAEGFTDIADQTRLGFFDQSKGEVEQLFKRMDLVAAALAAAGVLILFSGVVTLARKSERKSITTADSMWLGFIQGLSLPFRGFSRSGVTISLGLLRGISRQRAEEFSFAMAVALTPPAIGYEAYRVYEKMKQSSPIGMGMSDLMPGIKGMVFSFLAGLVALKLLSKLLEKGQWWLFGVYCLCAATAVYWIHLHS